MTAIQEFRNNLSYPTPVYATVGLIDRSVDQVRSASEKSVEFASDLGSQLKPQAIVNRAQQVASAQVEFVQSLPKRMESQGRAVYAQAERSYTDLSKRGAEVVAEMRKQQDAQFKQLVEQGKSSVESARKAAEEAQALATKGVLTGRKEVAKQVTVVADSVETAADKVGDSARTEVRSTAAKVGNVEKTAPKPAAKTTPAKKAAPKRPAAKKAPAKKATASKSAATKDTATKSAATKDAAKKA